MKPYTYLLVNFLTIIICFIFSFHPKIKFNKHFGAFLKAAVLVAIPFILWDVWFTNTGVWWFNDDYLVGTRMLDLPVEEWLFFICIPFSCVFTYYCLDKFFNLEWANMFSMTIVFTGVVFTITFAAIYSDKMYPFVTASATALTLIYLFFIAKADWIGKASLVFFILMLGFIPVNGVLTGWGLESPIVNYNPDQIINLRILTIPVEDAVYGYMQFLLVIYFFKLFQKKPELKITHGPRRTTEVQGNFSI